MSTAKFGVFLAENLQSVKTRLCEMVPAFVEKVAPIYRALNWEWRTPQGEKFIPDHSALTSKLFSLISDIDPSLNAWGSGGLLVWANDEGYGLTLEISEEGQYTPEEYLKFSQ
jgi:hypothetical protein